MRRIAVMLLLLACLQACSKPGNPVAPSSSAAVADAVRPLTTGVFPFVDRAGDRDGWVAIADPGDDPLARYRQLIDAVGREGVELRSVEDDACVELWFRDEATLDDPEFTGTQPIGAKPPARATVAGLECDVGGPVSDADIRVSLRASWGALGPQAAVQVRGGQSLSANGGSGTVPDYEIPPLEPRPAFDPGPVTPLDGERWVTPNLDAIGGCARILESTRPAIDSVSARIGPEDRVLASASPTELASRPAATATFSVIAGGPLVRLMAIEHPTGSHLLVINCGGG